ncbi:hypothetical protein HMPREF3038_00994 [Akkermansia sp. KLE1797]|nr:hypothetical protein HMPREF3038_00994 [Akkermansia sp. KLE1797]KXU54357.1 hypothetical protein HMPREF3039_01248 [Akkermansia sp. KLE1798]KZA05006.1 hypothetical protein HMPREF1326_01325 [Akkermansia sp. KLE1605]
MHIAAILISGLFRLEKGLYRRLIFTIFYSNSNICVDCGFFPPAHPF